MRGTSWLVLLIALTVAGGRAEAAEWGGIKPAESTMDTVRGRYGPPSSSKAGKVDGYDTMQWSYESPRTPSGIQRLVVDFGLLVGGSYRPQVVRTFRLEPKPDIFTRPTVLAGWGEPDRSSPVGEEPLWFFYETGLVIYFDKKGWQVQSMVFVQPQPATAGPGARQP
ncbi:MAG TPA: hypothetical protein VFR64_13840 [Methylomirabilota bacterium]|nr:hypothetical protein [Methylomirabilota bacterium]